MTADLHARIAQLEADLAKAREDNRRPTMWCQACGTVTRNGECDCTSMQSPELQDLQDYAREFHRQSDEAICALTAERDALREERAEAIKLMTQYAREAGEAAGKMETAKWPGVIDEWREQNIVLQGRLKTAQAAFSRFRDDLKTAPAVLQTNALVTSEWHVKNLGQALAQDGEKG